MYVEEGVYMQNDLEQTRGMLCVLFECPQTLPTIPTQSEKGATLIVGDSMLHKIEENRLQEAKPNSIKIRRATLDAMKDFLK